MSGPSRDEAARLAALRRYCVLDTPRERRFDELTRVAAFICQTPVSLISFVDSTRLYFKADYGLGAREVPFPDGFCAHAVRQREILEIPDTLEDARFAKHALVLQAPHVRFYAGMPLVTPDDFGLGTLCVIDFQPRKLPLVHREMLTLLARQVMSQLELTLQAIRDPLTGLYNRLPLEDALRREIVRAKLKGESVGVISIDVDHFKRINDNHGHDAGDAVLQAIAGRLLECARDLDVVCRVGDDKFVILLPGIGNALTLQRADLVRRRIEGAPFAIGSGEQRMTASVGIAVYPEHDVDAVELLRAADTAVHRAKTAGRNRVEPAR